VTTATCAGFPNQFCCCLLLVLLQLQVLDLSGNSLVGSSAEQQVLIDALPSAEVLVEMVWHALQVG
jgi:hypothetical protein